jgi:dTDP-4-amino-4,6-dideoxygalactose transaminase
VRDPEQRSTAEEPETKPFLPFVRPALPSLEEYSEALAPAWQKRMLSNFAEEAEEFERLLSAHFGSRLTLSVSSGDIGLVLAIAALVVPRGSEVIMPAFAYNSTLNAVLWNCLQPHFVDVSPDTYCIAPAAVERALSDRTGLIVATHVFGAACDVRALGDVARDAEIPLVFDAAQAIATNVGERHVSTWGDASAFSFSPTKVVLSGEGGAVVFRDPDPAERFRHLRTYGFQRDYVSRYVGLNGKLSELHAVLGRLSLQAVQDEVAARTRLREIYRERLAAAGLRLQGIPEGTRPSQTYLAIEVPDRYGVAAALAERGIQCKTYFEPLHRMPVAAGARADRLPVTERLAREVLCLPLYSELQAEDVHRVCDELVNVLQH